MQGPGRSATGLPDIGAIVLGTPEACAATSYPVTPAMIDCATVGKVPQTYRVQQGQYAYFVAHNAKLHGPVIRTSDSPDATRSTDVSIKAAEHAGITVTATPSQSNRDPQSAYTSIINQMKQDGSNFADNGLAAPGTILIRQEAALQGLTDPKIVWSCTSACYDQQQMAAAGSVMDGEYMPLGFLPFAEAKSNKTLTAFVKYVGKDNLGTVRGVRLDRGARVPRGGRHRVQGRGWAHRRRCSPGCRGSTRSTRTG